MNNNKWTKAKLPREVASEAKKQKIYKTALELFKEYGYDTITLKDISKKSGMSEGSIYNFFGSKTGIISGIRKRIYDNVAPLIVVNDAHLAQPIETIVKYLLAQGEGFVEIGSDLTSRFYTNLPFDSDNFRQLENPHAKINSSDENLLTFISEAKKAGTLESSLPAEEITSTLIILCNGLVSTWSLHSGNLPVLELSEHAFRNFLETLR